MAALSPCALWIIVMGLTKGRTATLNSLSLPALRPDQLAIAKHPAKTKVITAGRRYGKTVLGGVLAVNTLRQHGKVAWLAPTYKNSRPLWRWSMAVAGGHAAITLNKADRMIETRSGGLLAIYSGDNADAVRGESFHLVIVDEAAQLGEDIVNDVLLPTLADFDGELVLVGTPRGKNWFYHEWAKGQSGDPRYASWKLPTNLNPMPSIQRAFALAKDRVPERAYRQEWLAEFVEDGGEVFRKVRQAATGAWQDGPIVGHTYIIGADWGRSNDYTVFVVIDATDQALACFDRSNQIEYALQRGRLEALYRRFGAVAIIAESNAMGEPIIEMLARDGLPVQPFVTTNATKQAIIDGLANAFEREAIRLPDANAPGMDIIITELEAYSSERLPSGLIRFGAPSGMHDDCVMALAMAWSGASQQFEPAYEVVDAEPFTFSSSAW